MLQKNNFGGVTKLVFEIIPWGHFRQPENKTDLNQTTETSTVSMHAHGFLMVTLQSDVFEQFYLLP